MEENIEGIELHESEDSDNEMYEHFRFVVDKGQSPLRMDKFLFSRIENASRNKIQVAAKADCVLVNGKPEKPSYKVKPLDVITILMSKPPRDTDVIPQNIPLEIVYEDDDVIIVNKKAGMVVHPSYANYDGTLVNALTYYFNEQGKGAIPALVHRIDKDTSGLLLVAKNEVAQTYLAKQFFDHTVERRYQALVWGDFDEDEGTITGNLGRSAKDRRVVAVYPDGSQGRHAVTHYKVLQRFNYVTLVECRLETGRTHQIRAHMQYIKHPLFGDKTYGGDTIVKGTTFTKYKQFVNNCFDILPRQALHAKTIGFVHPTTHNLMQFDSDLPDDMQRVIAKWKKYVGE
ncbi:MAG: RluA family pseudouridine synthase [Bacteroidales bacterium]|nr:RluA family pseudouridine synthase [Bacteroidales bacterium]MBR5720337.1 RluA family pseudouridine synthase [Bacteroidales bacterium]